MKPALFFPLSLISATLVAAPPLTPPPLFFEHTESNAELVRDFAKKAQNQTAHPVETPPLDIQNKPDTLEPLINQALVQKRWALLEKLLPIYRQQSAEETTLYRYAKGALLRAQNHLPEAIKLYQQIVADNPHLAYPRFDLGVMLFENKQYNQAKPELLKALPELSATMRQLSAQYLAEIKNVQSWQPHFALQYVRTSNVNNASSAREVVLGGRVFIKDENSLPQSAHGLNFDVGATREINIKSNHFAYVGLNYNGVRYWDNPDFNEQSLHFSAGYRNRNARQTWGVIPFVEQNWLGSARYSANFGSTLSFSQQLNPRWQFTSQFTHQQKRYADSHTALRHNGYLHLLSFGLNWQAAQHWLIFANIDGNHDRSRDKAESSQRLGGSLGAVYATQKLGLQVSVRQAHRKFRAPNFYTGFNRKDREQQFNVALWHNKLAWKGFVPRLNYRYQRTLSNIPQFYSRSNGEWFITVEKHF